MAVVVAVNVLLIVAVIGWLWWMRQRTQRDPLVIADEPKLSWHCVAFGGGASTWLDNMTRTEAMSFCANNFGVVAFVDDERQHIFYKPPGWQGGYTSPPGI